MASVAKAAGAAGVEQPSDEDYISIGRLVELVAPEYPDVTQSSLRFLEREGLLTPARTPGGHRLYGQAHVQRLRQIKEWQAQRLSLEEIRERLAGLDAAPEPEDLAAEFLSRALSGDVPAARRTILDASELGVSLDVLFTAVLAPALRELGDRWERGDVSVAQEKEASEISRELIADLALGAAPASVAVQPVVAGCVAGERHELGLRMVSGLLGARGIGVHFLGADVAIPFLLDAVTLRRARAVLLSVTTDEQLPALREAAAELAALPQPPAILAGGQAVERNRDLVASWSVVPVRLTDIDALATEIRNRI